MAIRNAIAVGMLVAALAACAPSAREGSVPSMTRYKSGAVALDLPRGWSVAVDQRQGVITATLDPARQGSPVLWIRPGRPAAGASIDRLASTALATFGSDAAVRRQEAFANGKLVVVDARSGADALRAVVIVTLSGDAAVVGLLAASPAEFEALGGADLVSAVLLSAGAW